MVDRNINREPGPQPDPMLKEGPASSGRKWAILGAVVVILALTVFGISHRGDKNEAPPAAQSNNVPPQPATPSPARNSSQ